MENTSVNSHVEPLSEQLEQLERMQLHKENFENLVKSKVEKEDNNSILITRLIESWDGNCKIIHGRPRHPQSQGLVEQGNGTLERMIASMMTQFNTNNWVKLLPIIMFNLNTQESSATKEMPFEIVFKMKPNFGKNKKFVELVIQDNNECVEC
ncbi:unnamed protein product [Brachionus calyciflorus]|uniref:Integrase catalytic domain-containing protein n=1 Tax=Brachionus calyciflorus TaxID=104777 RepID=A0A813UBI2_9BILA|nr:unnamed protein product [Brachionus calyciflorus]